jgi:hypothetical protein
LLYKKKLKRAKEEKEKERARLEQERAEFDLSSISGGSLHEIGLKV